MKDVRDAGEALCGEEILEISRRPGGANSRIYYVRTARSSYALKAYAESGNSLHDRLVTEFTAATYLWENGLRHRIPEPIAYDAVWRYALFRWIDGVTLDEHGVSEMSEVLAFLRELLAVTRSGNPEYTADASDAAFSLSALLHTIDSRVAQVQGVGDEPELTSFISDEFMPELDRQRRKALEECDSQVRLDRTMATLSPSDFSLHNALRCHDGSLVFLDFEHFGWDDPAKLCSDFLWHPGHVLSGDEQAIFIEEARRIYGAIDPAFHSRWKAYFCLVGMNWALIVLNEFIPSELRRRLFADEGLSLGNRKSEQLKKSQRLLAHVRGIEISQVLGR